jgi:hypothetical protein
MAPFALAMVLLAGRIWRVAEPAAPAAPAGDGHERTLVTV